MTRYTSLSVFLFSALSLIIPSGFSIGAAMLFVGAIVLLKKPRPAILDRNDKIIMATLLFYFTVSILLNLLHHAQGKEYDLPLRFLLAIPALMLLRTYPAKPKYYWAGLAIGGILAACFGAGQLILLGVPRAGGHTNEIQFGNISFILGILCLSGLTWAKEQPQAKQWTLLLLSGFTLGILGAIMSGSRGSWIGLPLCLIIVYICYGKAFDKRIIWSSITALLIAGTIIYLLPQTGVKERVHLAINEAQDYANTHNATTSIGTRIEMWRAGALAAAERPILGWGKTGFVERETALIAEGKIDPFMAGNNHVYNEWLDALVKRGIPGLIALLALHFVPLSAFIRYFRQGTRSQRPYALAGILLITSYLTFGFSQVFMSHNSGVMSLGFMLVIVWSLMRNASALDMAK